MKKMIFLIIIIFFIFFIVSLDFALELKTENNLIATNQNNLKDETQRNILIELFINDNCTTCPKAAFCLEELAWSYEPGRVILVETHIWDDGHDTPETNARYDWYIGGGNKGTPDTFFNGLSERIQGLCCDCGDIDENVSAYQEIIDEQLAKSSPVKINAGYSICGGKIILQGDINNESHSMLHNLILSGMVYYEGDESELFYLVKDVFENQDICQLTPMEKKKFSFVSDLDLSGVEENEIDRYYCVVFVQDRLTKEVLQSYLVQ